MQMFLRAGGISYCEAKANVGTTRCAEQTTAEQVPVPLTVVVLVLVVD